MYALLKKLFSLLRLLAVGRKSEEDYSVFRPASRQIFTYFDGTAYRKADPMELYARMAAVGPELTIDMKVAQSPLKEAPKAYQRFLAGVRGIFEVEPLALAGDGRQKGLTQIETAALLDQFLIYCESLKKSSPPTPTAAATTSSPTPAAAGPSAEAAPATASSSPSGSSDGGSSTGTPGPSPSGPTSPSGT
jgi:hypothetical protein